MKVRSLFALALALTLPFAAVACSDDDSTGDFSESEIVEKLTASGISEDAAKCIAPKLKDADYDEDDFENPEKAGEISGLMQECLMGDVSIPSIPDGITVPEGLTVPETGS